MTFLDGSGIKAAVASGQRIGYIARYSNNLLDNDQPVREIITDQAQRDFVERANSGQAKMPFLCILHQDEYTKMGETKYLTWNGTDKVKFATAFGIVDSGLEQFAVELKNSPVDIALSHGYWRNPVERDRKDRTHITRYTPHEITVAPRGIVANKLTSIEFIALDGEKMTKDQIAAISEKIASALGTTPEAVSTVLYTNEATAKVIEGLIPSKTIANAEEVQEENEADDQAKTVEAKAETEDGEQTEDGGAKADTISVDYMRKAAELIGDLTSVVSAIGEQVAGIKQEIAEIKKAQDEQKTAADQVAQVASVESLLMIAGERISKMGYSEPVKDNKAVGDKPKEAKAQSDKPFGVHSNYIGVGE